MLNLLRIGQGIGYEVEAPLPVPPVFGLIASLGHVSAAEMWEVFNMGCGFCAIVPAADADAAVRLLARHHPGTAVIGRLTADAGRVSIPALPEPLAARVTFVAPTVDDKTRTIEARLELVNPRCARACATGRPGREALWTRWAGVAFWRQNEAKPPPKRLRAHPVPAGVFRLGSVGSERRYRRAP